MVRESWKRRPYKLTIAVGQRAEEVKDPRRKRRDSLSVFRAVLGA
jgi:hypothetical protein